MTSISPNRKKYMPNHPKQLLTTLLGVAILAWIMTPISAMGADNDASKTNSRHSKQAGTASLNLKDADLSNLIATVSQITGKNFVVDPRVKGKVTVISSSPMTPQGVYQAFLSVLEVHGYAAIPAGPVIDIMPVVNAKQQGGAKLKNHNPSLPGDIITKVIKVSNVPAAQLVPVLRPLVPQYGHLAAYTPANMLIISDRAANIRRMTNIIQRLDQQKKQNIDVIPLKYASASSLVTTLSKLQQNAQSGNKRGSQPAILADERTNSLVIRGSTSQRDRLRKLVKELDQPTTRSGGTQVIYLSHATAKDLAKILKGFIKAKSKSEKTKKKAPTGPVSIVADEDANALVVRAPPDTMRKVKSVIKQLDIRRGQVYVKAIIAEVSLSKARKLGVDFAAFNKNGAGVASLQQNGPAAVGQAAQSGDAAGALSLLKQGTNIAVGFVSGGTTFAALLNALYNDSKTNILSTPSLVTMDNEDAQIEVGKEVPFLTGSYSSGGLSTQGGNNVQTGLVNPFQTIDRKNVGIKLDITPQINQGNTVKLEIKARISSIANSNQGAVDLVTNKRKLETTVVVQDGQILVLGGLIDDNTRQSTHKVPFLSSIPLIGNLFKYRTSNKDKRNLMLFVRPAIFHGKTKADYYTRQKYQYIRKVQLSGKNNHLSLMKHENIPVLKPLPAYEQQNERVPGKSGTQPSDDAGSAADHAQAATSNRPYGAATGQRGLFTPPGSIFNVR